MRLHQLVAAAILFVAASAAAQAPLPVAERTFTRRGQSTRVSLFSNGAVVVTMSQDGVQGFMRQFTLEEQQYLVYLTAFQTNAAELGEDPIASDVGTSSAEVTVLLHIGPDAPRLLRFSPMSGLSLSMSKIMGALDDLQQQGLSASRSAEEMRTWEPKRRDRVQLLNGDFAVVREVWDDGLIVLEHESSHIRELVPPSSRDKVILRVVDEDE